MTFISVQSSFWWFSSVCKESLIPSKGYKKKAAPIFLFTNIFTFFNGNASLSFKILLPFL